MSEYEEHVDAVRATLAGARAGELEALSMGLRLAGGVLGAFGRSLHYWANAAADEEPFDDPLCRISMGRALAKGGARRRLPRAFGPC